MSINSLLLPNIHKIKVIFTVWTYFQVFSPSGMILRSLINKTSTIRIPNFSISFFSKAVQWYIEHYSTEATRFVSDLVGNPKDRFSHNEAHIMLWLHFGWNDDL